MRQLPFDIPHSLSSYAEHFEDDPVKATKRLKKQLDKRGPDAVGHSLLAWFYHLKGMDSQAVDEALKARIFAPGSPFFQKLHYYLSHPKAFEAWTPESTPPGSQTSSKSVRERGPVLNLDSLIEKLSAVESEQIHPKIEKEEMDEPAQVISKDDNVDDIVSETLASIHENQGKMDAAIRIYERLIGVNKNKRDHYSNQIQRLQKLKEENSEE